VSLACVALLAALLGAAGPSRAEVVRHALVIGVMDGGGSLEPLKYAEQDARRFADLLVEIGGFDAERVTVLYSPRAESVLAAMEAHDRLAGALPDDLFLLYYSGHADARGLRLGEQVLRYEELRAAMRRMPAEVRVGILDACRSGAMARLKGARVTAPFLVDDSELAAQGEAWLLAATADESAQESDQIRGSFFTHYLVSGLRGAADDGDGLVSLDEVYRYAYKRTVARTGATEAGAQHPVYDFRLQGQGDLYLSDVRKALARATIPAEIDGEITVLRLPDRAPVAEIAKPRGEAVRLALAPGRYLFRRRGDEGLQEVSVLLSEGSEITIARFGAPTPLEVAQLKGIPTLQDLGLELGVDLGRLAEQGQQIVEAMDLRHSPYIAGGLSVLTPGAGQAYNGQWVKGGLLFLGTASLFGGGVLWQSADPQGRSGSLIGSDLAMGIGAALYGFSVADAAWTARKKETFRPRKGVVLLTETGWEVSEGTEWPTDTGIAADWIMVPGFSLGLDRTGIVTHADGSRTFGMGSRMTLGADAWRRLRPGAFMAFGFRAGSFDDGISGLRPAWAAGANLRWYLTPRYLVELEGREQWVGQRANLVLAGGIGVHLGR
jgi:hypothetical protein